VANTFLAGGLFSHSRSPEKALVAATFAQSVFLHGVIRCYAGLHMSERKARTLGALSYLGEAWQMFHLWNAGQVMHPDMYGLTYGAGALAFVLLILPGDKLKDD
jgi:hypothetical protein